MASVPRRSLPCCCFSSFWAACIWSFQEGHSPRDAMTNSFNPLLSMKLSADYPGRPVFRDLTLTMQRGEILGLVGQSGSGKSTLALSVLRLLDFKGGRASGEIHFLGRDLMRLPEPEMRRVRGRQIGLGLPRPIAPLKSCLRVRSPLSGARQGDARGGGPGAGVGQKVMPPAAEGG